MTLFIPLIAKKLPYLSHPWDDNNVPLHTHIWTWTWTHFPTIFTFFDDSSSDACMRKHNLPFTCVMMMMMMLTHVFTLIISYLRCRATRTYIHFHFLLNKVLHYALVLYYLSDVMCCYCTHTHTCGVVVTYTLEHVCDRTLKIA